MTDMTDFQPVQANVTYTVDEPHAWSEMARFIAKDKDLLINESGELRTRDGAFIAKSVTELAKIARDHEWVFENSQGKRHFNWTKIPGVLDGVTWTK